MKTFISLFTCLCFAQLATGQQLHVNETRFIIGDSICGNGVEYTIPTADHGLLFVGETSCNNAGDIPPTNTSSTDVDVLICKMDSNMHLSWVKVYGGTQLDEAQSVCATADGGYAVLARSESSDGDVPGLKGFVDMWLIKTDANGNKQWSTVWGSDGATGPMSVAQTPDHGFILLGATNGANYDVQFQYVNTPFLLDWLLIKTDSLGNKQWSKTLGGTGDEGAFGSILVANDGYYIASSSTSKDHDCNDSSWHLGVNTNADIFLIKLDTAGNLLWDSSYGGSLDEQAENAIYDARDSSIVIAGTTASSDYMVHDHQGRAANNNCWVIKTDKNGKLLWETTLIDTNTVNSLNSANSITLGPNGGYAVFADVYIGSIGTQDGRVFIIDSIGRVLANKIVGGINYEWNTGICPYMNGYALIGKTSSKVFTEGINLNQSPSNGNAFVSYVDYWPEEVQPVNKNKVQQQLLCYPNPAQSQVRVQLTTGVMDGGLVVLSSTGKKIYEQKAETSFININTSNWAKGIYVVQYASDGGDVVSAKITIE